MARRRKKRKQSQPRPSEPAKPRQFEELLDEFLEWMQIRGYSERTVENYRVYIGYFLVWCDERGLESPSEVSRPVLERFQRYLYYYRQQSGRPLAFRSQQARLQPVRSFFRWLARQSYIRYNPAESIELPRTERRLPKAVLTIEEVERVLAQPDASSVLGLRDRAILETFYSTGMRRLELVSLEVYDLDVERRTVFIRQGKGRRDRVVPIGEPALAWIERYQTRSRPQLVAVAESKELFLTNQGERLTKGRLTQLVRGYLDGAEIEKPGSCHLFRHTMATLMLEGGADVRFIQQMLGHSSLSTTQIYTQVSIQQLRKVHAATHPSARLEGSALAAEEQEGEERPSEEKLLSLLAAEAAEEEETDEV